MKPTGGEGERQAGATPIFPKKTEEPENSQGKDESDTSTFRKIILVFKQSTAFIPLKPCLFDVLLFNLLCFLFINKI